MNQDESTAGPLISAAIIRLDDKRRIDSVNKEAEALLGMAAAELSGRRIETIINSPSGPAGLPALLDMVRTGGIVRNFPVRIGSRAEEFSGPRLATILPLPAGSSLPAGVLLLIEESPAEPPCRDILDSVADGIFTVNREWTITSFNRAAERITGWPAAEAIGKSCSEVFHSSICGKNCLVAESLYGGRPVANRSITIRNIDGESIPVSISASPLTDEEGIITGGVEIFRDLSFLASAPKLAARRHNLDGIVSKSAAMQRLFAILPDIAASPSTVLICGESGTGKELAARALHNLSDRRDMPFVALNCGALPETLLESELFGYKAGAFTDARRDKEGRFAAAEGGTLFLDEIGDIPHGLQVKLLRVLQEKVYEPLGANVPVNSDVRIITATNRDLAQLVRKGMFRDDLFYRLNVVRIQLPPLRERKEDIPLLIDEFIREFSGRMAKDIVGIASQALDILRQYDFPGNIRELKNIIEYAFILCDGGYILPEHLPEPFNGATAAPEPPLSVETDKSRTLEEIERQAIRIALERNRWKKNATCEELGISKDTLRRKLVRYNLEPPGTLAADEFESD
ncbi:MAG: sigma 54-interacting transcriptional regulator [Desulfobulbaceae bacterium]